MVGRAVTLFPKVDAPIGDVLLQVDGLSRGEAFRDVSFSVRAGEIPAWPAWSARAGPKSRGCCSASTVRTPARSPRGEVVAFSSPSAAPPTGSRYVPEDRHQDGLVPLPDAPNVTPPILPRLFPRLLIQPGIERKIGARYIDQLRIRATGVDQLASALSGGNQQKVVLGKWLASEPRVLILDEPTRGIDIGAKVEVHRIISELAASGLAIILISSDLPEVLAMSDRILVLHEGSVTAEILAPTRPRNRSCSRRPPRPASPWAADPTNSTNPRATAPRDRPMSDAAAIAQSHPRAR